MPIILNAEQSREMIRRLTHPDAEQIRRRDEMLEGIQIAYNREGYTAEIPDLDLSFITE